jgi:hypothetical protein
VDGQPPREAGGAPRTAVSSAQERPHHETFVTLFGKAASNIVEHVAILMTNDKSKTRSSIPRFLWQT